MRDLEHAKAMLTAAQKDLRALTGMQDSNVFADEIFGFHGQQAVEKALKAWMSALGLIYPRTHDVGRLLTLLENRGEDVTPYWPLAAYNMFVAQARYEGMESSDEPLDRHVMIEEVNTLVRHVERIVETE
ncbi:MAG: HEPN domain-containing protein [Gammaproteobacteria bacterium]|nr:HEPN domain-containing protein [Gammaproteobacteria bacterium]